MRFRLLVPIALALSLAGCAANLPSSPSKVPKSSTARQIAQLMPACRRIEKIYVTDLIQGGTAAQAEKLRRSHTAVSCDLGRASLSIDSNPASKEPQVAVHSEPAEYLLVGPTWSIDVGGSTSSLTSALKTPSLSRQLKILTQVQKTLGGKLLFDS